MPAELDAVHCRVLLQCWRLPLCMLQLLYFATRKELLLHGFGALLVACTKKYLAADVLSSQVGTSKLARSRAWSATTVTARACSMPPLQNKY